MAAHQRSAPKQGTNPEYQLSTDNGSLARAPETFAIGIHRVSRAACFELHQRIAAMALAWKLRPER